jgi:hypothetical protein
VGGLTTDAKRLSHVGPRSTVELAGGGNLGSGETIRFLGDAEQRSSPLQPRRPRTSDNPRQPNQLLAQGLVSG